MADEASDLIGDSVLLVEPITGWPLPIRVRRVWSTDTTVTDALGLF